MTKKVNRPKNATLASPDKHPMAESLIKCSIILGLTILISLAIIYLGAPLSKKIIIQSSKEELVSYCKTMWMIIGPFFGFVAAQIYKIFVA